jgi:hypothetical protein
MYIIGKLISNVLCYSWKNYRLTRTEIVTLINSFQRYSNTLKAIGRFKKMWEERDRAEESGIDKPKVEAPKVEPEVKPEPVKEAKKVEPEPAKQRKQETKRDNEVRPPLNLPDWLLGVVSRPSILFVMIGFMALTLIIALVFWLEPEAETTRKEAEAKAKANRVNGHRKTAKAKKVE